MTIPRKKLRVALQLIGSAAFVLVGLLFVVIAIQVEPRTPRSWVFMVVGLLAMITFGTFGVMGIRLLHRPALVIHDAGIHDNTSPISVGTIPWEQALGFYPTTFQTMGAKNDLVGVIWADEQQVWQRMSPGVRRLNRANIGFNVPPGAISADMLRPHRC